MVAHEGGRAAEEIPCSWKDACLDGLHRRAHRRGAGPVRLGGGALTVRYPEEAAEVTARYREDRAEVTVLTTAPALSVTQSQALLTTLVAASLVRSYLVQLQTDTPQDIHAARPLTKWH